MEGTAVAADRDDSHGKMATLAAGARTAAAGTRAWSMRPRAAPTERKGEGMPLRSRRLRFPRFAAAMRMGGAPPGAELLAAPDQRSSRSVAAKASAAGTLLAMIALWPALPGRVGRRVPRMVRGIALMGLGALLSVLFLELRGDPAPERGVPETPPAMLAGAGRQAPRPPPAGAVVPSALAPGGALALAPPAAVDLREPLPSTPAEPLVPGGAVVVPPPSPPALRTSWSASGRAPVAAAEPRPEPAAGPVPAAPSAPSEDRPGAAVADAAVRAPRAPDRGRLVGQLMYEIGWHKQRSGDVQGAMDVYRRAAELIPDHGAIYYNWGYLLQRQGDTRGAIEKYRKAISHRPVHPYAYYNLAYLLQQEGYVNSAIAHYRMGIELNPEHALAHYNLAWLLQGQGEETAAAEHYRRALELDPTHALAHYGLAYLLQEGGDLAGAVRAYRRTLELEPDHALAREALRDLLTVQARSLAGASEVAQRR